MVVESIATGVGVDAVDTTLYLGRLATILDSERITTGVALLEEGTSLCVGVQVGSRVLEDINGMNLLDINGIALVASDG